ncbi:MAG: Mor transcription activator family protein [Jaaginema sp. PMC 1079.18]|nr:Mor transcription activator family protein [Jaaginema sp. PMC 1080.18]MEC4850113.1 Mor transcription activator family protein [Jaaginema sp. PMC 1079.18]MEC4864799.1 Mor transcription activator family protein [Jaaginema sp. PMC 1078.18]
MTKIEQLQELLGKEKFEKFCRAFAGKHVYIPKEENEPMIATVGREAAEKLQAEWGGCSVDIPLFRDRQREKRNQEIVELSHEKTIEQLADIFDLSRRHIWRILKENATKKEDYTRPA